MSVVYTDGSWIRDPSDPGIRVGGWAFVCIRSTGKRVSVSGGHDYTTNNRMELTAVIEALKYVKKYNLRNTVIYTDSTYVKNGVMKYMPKWKTKNWKGSTGETVKNVDLWKDLDLLTKNRSVTVKWVRGHSGNKDNELADKLAKREAATRARVLKKVLSDI